MLKHVDHLFQMLLLVVFKIQFFQVIFTLRNWMIEICDRPLISVLQLLGHFMSLFLLIFIKIRKYLLNVQRILDAAFQNHIYVKSIFLVNLLRMLASLLRAMKNIAILTKCRFDFVCSFANCQVWLFIVIEDVMIFFLRKWREIKALTNSMLCRLWSSRYGFELLSILVFGWVEHHLLSDWWLNLRSLIKL
jgi:hypothetical protein